jgi:Protein of unknown function (DUF2848)
MFRLMGGVDKIRASDAKKLAEGQEPGSDRVAAKTVSMSANILRFRTHRGASIDERAVPLRRAVIAGWTQRDSVAREKHIAELEALGVGRPTSTPIYYRVSASRLTTSEEIEAVGENSSGEVEFVLVRNEGGLWIGVGSDHTDRTVETYNVTVSKQMCDKPIAPELWCFEDVRDHWDSLALRSWIEENGEARLYQEGSVASILSPDQIIAGIAATGRLAEGTALFCGTLPAKGGIRPSKKFSFELFDPVRNVGISHAYTVDILQSAG